jgi:hypothetical protein
MIEAVVVSGSDRYSLALFGQNDLRLMGVPIAIDTKKILPTPDLDLLLTAFRNAIVYPENFQLPKDQMLITVLETVLFGLFIKQSLVHTGDVFQCQAGNSFYSKRANIHKFGWFTFRKAVFGF